MHYIKHPEGKTSLLLGVSLEKKSITFSKELINLMNIRQCPGMQGRDDFFYFDKHKIKYSKLMSLDELSGLLTTDVCPSVFASYPFHYYDH